MTDPQGRLWAKLKDMPLGPAEAVVTFEDKLIRQTAWPRSLAERAVAEYRRYLLLAATCGHPVSPSPAVDEVWHLHLLYTRHYWKTLCPDVLGMELHHEPATGTPMNRSALGDDYAKTLASYEAAFGEPPPVDLWPRTATSGRFDRVDRDRFVVLPRRATFVAATVVGMIFVVLIGILLWEWVR
jgi:hypothetical protein